MRNPTPEQLAEESRVFLLKIERLWTARFSAGKTSPLLTKLYKAAQRRHARRVCRLPSP